MNPNKWSTTQYHKPHKLTDCSLHFLFCFQIYELWAGVYENIEIMMPSMPNTLISLHDIQFGMGKLNLERGIVFWKLPKKTYVWGTYVAWAWSSSSKTIVLTRPLLTRPYKCIFVFWKSSHGIPHRNSCLCRSFCVLIRTQKKNYTSFPHQLKVSLLSTYYILFSSDFFNCFRSNSLSR